MDEPEGSETGVRQFREQTPEDRDQRTGPEDRTQTTQRPENRSPENKD